MAKTNVTPLGENVLIEGMKLGKKTEAGIYLPENSSEEKPQEGKVIAIGDSEKIKVKKNQKVIFNRYGGTEVKVGDSDYLIVKNEDILAILE